MKKNLLLCLLALLPGIHGYAQVPFTLFDVNPGKNGSWPSSFVMQGKEMMFAAENDTADTELFITNGKKGGIRIVKDIYPGKEGSYAHDFTEMNGRHYFIARDTMSNYELWGSDGTDTGTRKVIELWPFAGGVTNPGRAVLNNKLLFCGTNGSTGQELWITDGTDTGTHLLKEYMPGFTGGNPFYTRSSAVLNNKVYFCATDSSGAELWSSDGTTAGTTGIDVVPGKSSSMPSYITAFNNSIFFVGDTKIYVSDGTQAGTKVLLDSFNHEAFIVSGIWPYLNKLLISGGTKSMGSELFISDGTTAGTKLLKDINPGTSPAMVYPINVYNNRWYFSAENAVSGRELWSTDGTDTGTRMVHDIINGNVGSFPEAGVVYRGELYFAANQSAGDKQLFKTDGTAAGTLPVLNPKATLSNPLGNSPELFVMDTTLFFSAEYDTSGVELWAIYADTSKVVPPPPATVLETDGGDFSLYPNPSGGSFVITLDKQERKDVTVKIYDLSGRILQHKLTRSGQQIVIDIYGAASGVYIVHVEAGDKLYTRRVTIE